MRVVLSWSGTRSRAVAEALRDWLPYVIPDLEPWMSAEDIEKGARWATDIARELESARIGIICVTPENPSSPWILFEVGALAKTLEKTYVCPYLVGLQPADLPKDHPLTLFQATKAEKEDTRRLLQTINRTLEAKALPEVRLDTIFEKWWPDLEARLNNLPTDDKQKQTRRPDREIAEETLELVRNLARSLSELKIEKLEQKISDLFAQQAGMTLKELLTRESPVRPSVVRPPVRTHLEPPPSPELPSKMEPPPSTLEPPPSASPPPPPSPRPPQSPMRPPPSRRERRW